MINVLTPTVLKGQEQDVPVEGAEAPSGPCRPSTPGHLPAGLAHQAHGGQHVITLDGRDDLPHQSGREGLYNAF